MTQPAGVDASVVPIGRGAGEVSGTPLWQPRRQPTEVRAVIGYALTQLRNKRARQRLLWRYYDGDHPQLWMTEKLRQTFGPAFEGSLQENYCELVVESVVGRLDVTGWGDKAPAAAGATPVEGQTGTAGDTAPDAGAGGMTEPQRMAEVWEANHLDLEQEELYRKARVAGEAYLIVWPRYDERGQQATTDAGTPLWDVAVNDSQLVHLEVGGNRGQRLWAAKVWVDTTAPGGPAWRANVYYDDELVRMRMPSGKGGSGGLQSMPAKADRFELDTDDPGGPNPLGAVPVFRFSRHRACRSALTIAVPVQDKINKLAANKMVAAEFAAWRQRVLLTAQDVPDSKLRPSPGGWLVLDPGGETEEGNAPETKVVELEATELANYDNSKSSEVDALFTLCQLPRHLRINPGTPPSGDAVRADESPFISMVEAHQKAYGASWADVAQALGYNAVPTWRDATVANDEAEARTVEAYVRAMVPVDIALEYVAGWPEEKLTKLRARLKEEADALAASQAAQREAMAAAFDSGAVNSYAGGGAAASGG